MRRFGDEDGSILVLTALCLTVLLGFAALACDVGYLLLQRRDAQNAADAAAMAGVDEINWASNDGTTVAAAAQAAATQNGFTNGSNGVTVTVNNGPASGPYTGNANYVEVIVQRSVPTFFMRLFHLNAVNVSARAVAGFGGGDGCVYTLGSSGVGLNVTGTGSIAMPSCNILVNSDSSSAITETGTASITGNQIGVVGNYVLTGSGVISPTPTTGMDAASDPLAYLAQPTVPSNCSAGINYSSTTAGSITEGCYKGISLSGGSSLSLGPGMYVIDGSISLTGNTTLSGTGVTIFTNGSISGSGSSAFNLSAPTSGTYNGILFFEARTDSSSDSLSGGAASTIKGIFYAPDASVTYTGNSSSNISASFVVKSLTLTGGSSLKGYALGNGSNSLGSAALME